MLEHTVVFLAGVCLPIVVFLGQAFAVSRRAVRCPICEERFDPRAERTGLLPVRGKRHTYGPICGRCACERQRMLESRDPVTMTPGAVVFFARAPRHKVRHYFPMEIAR